MPERQSGLRTSRNLMLASGGMAAAAVALAFNAPALLLASVAGIAVLAAAPMLIYKPKPATASGEASARKRPGTKEPPQQAGDVHERRWEMGEAGSQITSLFDALGDMVVTTDIHGRILFANAPFRKATGQENPVGKQIATVGIAPYATVAGREIALGFGADETVWAWHETTAREPGSGGLVIHGIGRDITSERRACQALIEAREKAEAASHAKSRFLATVSHEIRTPLNGILGMTHLLGNTPVTPEQVSYLKTVRESGHSLMALIEDLLDVTSIEAGRFDLRQADGDLHELIHGVTELMASRAHDKGIEIAVHIAPDVPQRIVTDHGRLRQVLFNLIGNAIKFTDKGGVLVEVACEETSLRVRVSDSGPGLKLEDRARVFQEFERGDHASTRRHGGAGLGLAISARILDAMKGDISVDSTLGRGSTFTFRVPLAVGEAKAVSTLNASFGDAPLESKIVLVLAPQGPVATSLVWSIRDLGGAAEAADDHDSLLAALSRFTRAGRIVTDILIDRRISDRAAELMSSTPVDFTDDVARTLVIAPEDSRDISLSPEAAASAWLVRPVRVQSLVSVLTGRDDRADRNRLALTKKRVLQVRPSDAVTHDILLAEDNPVNALLVRTILAREGHRVTVVTNGYQLIEEAMKRPDGKPLYDLVITDLSMPELDGKSALVTIRNQEETNGYCRLPVIVLSADGQAGTRDELLSAGADGHAEKPVDPAWLVSLVAMTVHGAEKARA